MAFPQVIDELEHAVEMIRHSQQEVRGCKGKETTKHGSQQEKDDQRAIVNKACGIIHKLRKELESFPRSPERLNGEQRLVLKEDTKTNSKPSTLTLKKEQPRVENKPTVDSEVVKLSIELAVQTRTYEQLRDEHSLLSNRVLLAEDNAKLSKDLSISLVVTLTAVSFLYVSMFFYQPLTYVELLIALVLGGIIAAGTWSLSKIFALACKAEIVNHK